jgi:hypothetical protein
MPALAETKSMYLRAVNQELQYVRGKMDIGASNKPHPGMLAAALCTGSLINKGELREHVDQDLARIKHPGWKDVLESSADWAKHYGCGNCGEQSALAFVYLRNMGIRPLDWMEVNNFQHAFVVVGRDHDSDPADYTTWGRTAYYCDPWLGACGEAVVLHSRYWRKKMEVLHREE